MEDEQPQNEEFDPFESLPSLMAISIVVGEGPPQVDLGELPPHSALAVLEKVVESLRECLLPPVIKYEDRTIYNPYSEEFYEDDEEEYDDEED